jgi:hypothetical protein
VPLWQLPTGEGPPGASRPTIIAIERSETCVDFDRLQGDTLQTFYRIDLHGMREANIDVLTREITGVHIDVHREGLDAIGKKWGVSWCRFLKRGF